MQYIDEVIPWDDKQVIHRIVDELVNIVGLCQLLQRAEEPSEIERYAGILSDVANETIRLCGELRDKYMPD